MALAKRPELLELISLSATMKVIANPTSRLVGLVKREDYGDHLAERGDLEVAPATLGIRKIWAGLLGSWSQNQGNREECESQDPRGVSQGSRHPNPKPTWDSNLKDLSISITTQPPSRPVGYSPLLRSRALGLEGFTIAHR